MPKAVQDRIRTPIAPPPTSRRHILAALSGAALAGGGLVLAMPTEAPATPITEPGDDAELFAMIARFDATERHIWGSKRRVGCLQPTNGLDEAVNARRTET